LQGFKRLSAKNHGR